MNKELTPLEWLNYYKRIIRQSHETFRPNGFDAIENALKDYENTLVRLDDTQALLWEKQKKVDAWDIIVNKDVEIGLMKSILHADKSLHTASYYNSHFTATYRHLTQEEFDLLKEVLQ